MTLSEFTISAKRIPKAPYKKFIVATGCIAVVLCICAEIFFRAQGHLPSVTDDKALWAYKRSQIYGKNGERVIVLLGASRIQLGLDPNIMEQKLKKYKVIMLAVDGHGTLSALQDLAEDPKFNGIVLCSTSGNNMFSEDLKPWIKYYYQSRNNLKWINSVLNLKIRITLQQYLVIFSFWTNFERQIGYIFRIPISHEFMRADRYRPANYYDRMDSSELKNRRLARFQKKSEIKTIIEKNIEKNLFYKKLKNHIRPLVQRMRSKGGDIIFIHMPLPDQHFEMKNFPKKYFWNFIAPITDAHTIHFKDFSSLNQFYCPDGSHLDYHDGIKFTKNLGAILKSKL